MYGYIGSMTTQPGQRAGVITLLLTGAAALEAAGCVQYLVAAAADDEVTIWVTEVWSSKDAHDQSLQLPAVRSAIRRAMPLLTGHFTSQETTPAGGLGVPAV